MRKFTVLLLSLICLSFNMLIATPVAAATVLKEGVYKVDELKFSSDIIYIIENVSTTNSINIFVFDKDEVIQQSIRLQPKSQKYNLLPLQADYKISIIGKGEALIS
ncbi:hypothetical protein [Clostridium vincentii]|uniref:Uncharacterized protein n=1 Tax=Clostridium vincentii TaxID=52704 RepID=A0A2T0BHJ6_9CLOT|nr:hypothetical protein [Clostridium vincentii]PRR83369.1 hypothetical protein CLVI_09160 [Clostridium vincentii]